MLQIQPVTRDDLYRGISTKPFRMIDNYVYLYHTDTLIALPLYPDSIQDSMATTYVDNFPMSRSAPIYTFSNSGPRSLQLELPLHRDMMNQINVDESRLNIPTEDLYSEDYVDIMIKQLQAAALPRYADAEKMVNPPLVAVRFGNSLFCKGVVQGGVTVVHSGPILSNDKYALITVSFNVLEVDPYDADAVILEGGFRGIRTTLESRVFRGGSAGVSSGLIGGGGGPSHFTTSMLR